MNAKPESDLHQRLRQRLERIDRAALGASLDADGLALLPALLEPAQCETLRAVYERRELFRSNIVMQRHNYGRGEYRYFADPLPEPVATLRSALYECLLPTARRWSTAAGDAADYPTTHAEFRARCHAAGQCRPTPLLLRYGPGDYNCLHRDLYGALAFPLQVVVLLSEPAVDFQGGEFVLVEQRPRLQSRVRVAGLRRGDAAAFAVSRRPVAGRRGWSRVDLRHGIGEVTAGQRYALGVIFHDAA